MADYTQLESSSAGLKYETLLTTTHMANLDSGRVHDNVFNANPTWRWFNEKGRLKMIDGGERLQQGILYGENSTAGWYSGHGLLDVTAQEGVTSAFFVWKQAAVSIVYSGRELRLNAGSKTKIADLVKTKQNQAELSLVKLLATGFFSDGTGSGGLQLTGLDAMHEDTPGTTSYAAVPTTNTAWRNQVQAAAGAAATNLLTYMRQVYNKCCQGKGDAASEPDGVVTTREMYEAYEALHVPALRFASAKEGDLGFQKLRYKGAEMWWDAYCPSGDVHFLSSNHQSIVAHPAANITLSAGGFQIPANQDSYIGNLLWMGAVVTNNRRKTGKITGLT